MNNDLEQFSEERLKDMQKHVTAGMTLGHADALLIRQAIDIALAAKQAKPVTMDSLRDAVAEMTGGIPMSWEKGYEKGGQVVPFINFNSLHRIVTKFTTPQPAHTEQDGWIEFVSNIADDTHQNESLRDWAKNLLAAAPKPESE